MPRKKAAPSIPTVDHTQAILVALAYLIGFITSYIAFELNDRVYVAKPIDSVPTTQQAVAYGAVKAVATEEGLFVSADGHERIVSATLEEGELSLGYHRAIAVAEVSPDGEFLFYCAIMDDPSVCVPFVYSRQDDTVYLVTGAEGSLEVDVASAGRSGWSSNGALSLDGMMSISPSRPWMVR